MSLSRSSLLLDLDAQAVRVDVDLDDLAEQPRGRRRRAPGPSSPARAATMPAWMAAPRATTSLTASELSGALPLSSCSICRSSACASSRRPAARGRPGPRSARPGAAPAAWSAACASAGRGSASSNSARVSGTVSTLPACVQVMLVCGSLLSVRLARSAAACRPASDCGSVRGSLAVLLLELRRRRDRRCGRPSPCRPGGRRPRWPASRSGAATAGPASRRRCRRPGRRPARSAARRAGRWSGRSSPAPRGGWNE